MTSRIETHVIVMNGDARASDVACLCNSLLRSPAVRSVGVLPDGRALSLKVRVVKSQMSALLPIILDNASRIERMHTMEDYVARQRRMGA